MGSRISPYKKYRFSHGRLGPCILDLERCILFQEGFPAHPLGFVEGNKISVQLYPSEPEMHGEIAGGFIRFTIGDMVGLEPVE